MFLNTLLNKDLKTLHLQLYWVLKCMYYLFQRLRESSVSLKTISTSELFIKSLWSTVCLFYCHNLSLILKGFISQLLYGKAIEILQSYFSTKDTHQNQIPKNQISVPEPLRQETLAVLRLRSEIPKLKCCQKYFCDSTLKLKCCKTKFLDQNMKLKCRVRNLYNLIWENKMLQKHIFPRETQ